MNGHEIREYIEAQVYELVNAGGVIEDKKEYIESVFNLLVENSPKNISKELKEEKELFNEIAENIVNDYTEKEVKYANFRDNEGDIVSIEVDEDLCTTSSAFDSMVDNFKSNEGCENGEFVGFSDEPEGEVL